MEQASEQPNYIEIKSQELGLVRELLQLLREPGRDQLEPLDVLNRSGLREKLSVETLVKRLIGLETALQDSNTGANLLELIAHLSRKMPHALIFKDGTEVTNGGEHFETKRPTLEE